ncbi:MAG: catalase [Burkholderiaceae bacterium]|nr:catalase [Burkholderiaceae bacterium]
MTQAPSTRWQERIAPDEQFRYEQAAQQIVAIQRQRSERFGTGRALHRKGITAAHGELTVAAGLPPHAAHGLFAQPGRHEVWLRLSNGGMDRAADRKPDIRGFSLRVFGVSGDSALGNGPAKSQDFTLINQDAFSTSGSAEFIEFVVAASQGGTALLKFLVRRYGVLGAVGQVRKALRTFGKPFGGFATEPFNSVLPMACGPYAVRVRVTPDPANGAPSAGAPGDWNADFSNRLARRPLAWDMALQFFTEEAVTPIEDASVAWPTPWLTVARLTLPAQDTGSAAGAALSEQVEGSVFDPWQALAEHRPLGDVQRARKVVYFASQKARGAAS